MCLQEVTLSSGGTILREGSRFSRNGAGADRPLTATANSRIPSEKALHRNIIEDAVSCVLWELNWALSTCTRCVLVLPVLVLLTHTIFVRNFLTFMCKSHIMPDATCGVFTAVKTQWELFRVVTLCYVVLLRNFSILS